MKKVAQNGLLDPKEFDAFKKRTIKLRFMHTIASGLGAASVFGLFAGISTKLVPMALGGEVTKVVAGVLTTVVAAPSIPAIIGLVTLGVVGLGLLYFGAKFLSENILLEQDFGAKKIASEMQEQSPEKVAAKAVEKAKEATKETTEITNQAIEKATGRQTIEKTPSFPAQESAALQAAETPDNLAVGASHQGAGLKASVGTPIAARHEIEVVDAATHAHRSQLAARDLATLTTDGRVH